MVEGCHSGLPDGIFAKNPNLDIPILGRTLNGKCWYILISILFIYVMAIWHIQWLFSPFWYVVPRKIWQPRLALRGCDVAAIY
jgi:hypothetical protein